MATSDNLIEAFEDLGFTIEDPKAVDRLLSFCDIFALDEAKLSYEYLAFASKKKLATTAPTLTIVEAFEKDLSKTLASNRASKAAIESATSSVIYDSSTLPSMMMEDNSFGQNSDMDESALNFYGTPRANRSSHQKRQLTPDNSLMNKRHAGAGLASNSPMVTFSPTSYKATTPASKKFSARTNGGQVLIRFDGNTSSSQGTQMPDSFWRSDASYVANISGFDPAKQFRGQSYRYMFERLREKAGFLDETICRISDVIVTKSWANDSLDGEPVEPSDFCQVMPDPFPVTGRICCDAAEGRLNAKSIVLQGSQDICRGRTLPLDASQVSDYSLFPGQIVGAKVTNPNGGKLVAFKIWNDASPPLPTTRIKLNNPTETMDLAVASGPFTTSTNLDYEPLKDLLSYVTSHKPQVLILCGPFLDERHPVIESGILSEQFEAIFGRIVTTIAEAVEDLPTQVVIVPSHREIHHHPIYPTPAFEDNRYPEKIKMVSDPTILNIDGVLVGVTSADILFHLGKEEISFPPNSGDRLRRLSNHLVQQQSFYPLYPPNEDISLDLEQLEAFGQMPVQPHILILPSDLLHFFKELNGCLVTNPQRLVKGEGGGVFARIKVSGVKADDAADQPFVQRVHAEIVRI